MLSTRQDPARRLGSSTIEMAFIILPMFAVLFLTVDVCMLFFLRTTFQHAAREGVRYAVTSRVLNNAGQDESIRQQVQTSAMGFLNGDSKKAMIRIRYYDPITLTETGVNSAGNIVEVSVEDYPYVPLAPFWHADGTVNITVRSSDRMEAQPNGPPAR